MGKESSDWTGVALAPVGLADIKWRSKVAHTVAQRIVREGSTGTKSCEGRFHSDRKSCEGRCNSHKKVVREYSTIA